MCIRDSGTTTDSTDHLRLENEKDNIRKIFNQRPPSELISTNLAGYFPHTDMKKLERTLKESYRQSVRLSVSNNGRVPNIESNNVGDLLLKRSNAIDSALLHSVTQRHPSVPTLAPPTISHFTKSSSSAQLRQQQQQQQHTSSDRIELLADSDSHSDDEDIITFPTKMVTPKSWLKGARIGSGSFGTVYLGMNAQTGELMAVKQVGITAPPTPSAVVDKSKNSNSNGSGKNNSNGKIANDQAKNSPNMHKKMVDALQHEMNLLKELHHENIVTYYGSSQEGPNLNIFLEYVPGGSVSSMLNNYGPFEESLIVNFIRQVLIGVAYLHNKNIIHRDIKGANILIDTKGCVKITDFGISKKLSPLSKQDKRASLQGSVYWMAPEVVKQTATTEKADIWSTGCVVIEMFTGKHPFPDFSQMQTIFKIGTNTTPEVPSWASDLGKDFLSKTFEVNYKKRLSALEILQHPWLDTQHF